MDTQSTKWNHSSEGWDTDKWGPAPERYDTFKARTEQPQQQQKDFNAWPLLETIEEEDADWVHLPMGEGHDVSVGTSVTPPGQERQPQKNEQQPPEKRVKWGLNKGQVKHTSVWEEAERADGQDNGPSSSNTPSGCKNASQTNRHQRYKANQKGEVYGWKAEKLEYQEELANLTAGDLDAKIRPLSPQEQQALGIEVHGLFDGGRGGAAYSRLAHYDSCGQYYRFPHSVVRCFPDGKVVPKFSRKLEATTEALAAQFSALSLEQPSNQVMQTAVNRLHDSQAMPNQRDCCWRCYGHFFRNDIGEFL